jgi:4-amino-4-deoxy-L-arabinose transferase-like glycosyltransferase
MTTPPNTNADDAADGRAAPSHPDTQSPDAPAPDSDSGDASARATLAKDLRAPLARSLRTPLVFLAVFAALVLLHLTLIELPYYWDEAGYFIPAARDIYVDGSFVPHSTLSNAHPPLVMAYLALAWKLFGFQIAVARVAMLAVSAFALTGLFRLAERVQNTRVAAATVVCTALYPVFFAQSSLAHLDMMVAALTLWGLSFYLPPKWNHRPGFYPTDAHAREVEARNEAWRAAAGRFENVHVRRASAVFCFALAALAKETAVLVPVTLCAWELLTCRFFRTKTKHMMCVEYGGTVKRSLALLLACVPLALWFAYHRALTGYTFGNPEYFRYNVESTLNLSRMMEAGWGRLRHVTTHMNLWTLTLAGLAAMLLKPGRDGGRQRDRIDVRVQLVFLLLVAAHVVALSVVGGAVLARYMLPVLPLVILVWVSTIRRRVPAWPLAVALVCAAFAYRCEVNPSYNFPWEENLAYRDFVLLHRDAARFLSENYPEARVLTSWPATDELRNTYYGYTPRPLAVFPVESLKREDLEPAAAERARYDAALLYSTHGGLGLEEAARLLDARVVFHEERKGQWVAVVVKQ